MNEVEVMGRLTHRAAILGLGWFISGAAPAPRVPTITFEPYTFKAADGTTVEAERGVFRVPENRNDPGARQIEIGLVRFRSTSAHPGPPIIYLAGGPGGSGVATARGRRFPLFMAMREFGDVIALDQRGTGWSNVIPECKTAHRFPLDQPLTLERSMPLFRDAANECAAFWHAQGVDLAGYNTMENARDIETLRRALGVEKVSLWGISYGSHLALATIKVMPDHIERIVLAGLEGLDQTVKLPAHTDAYFARLQQAIAADSGAAAAYPDLAALMRRVHARLDTAPVTTTFTVAGEPVTMTVGKIEMQLLAAGLIADPASAARLPALYAMADAGDLSRIAPFVYSNLRRDPVSFRGMPEAMDLMSGVSAARLGLVARQAETSLLGDLLNFPMPHLVGTMALPDLGDDFRAPVKTSIPTLVFTGTLDGRTYPEAAAETLRGFANVRQVMVQNGGHNVFMQSPVISEIILRFMRGEDVPATVTLDAPVFLVPG
jgi:pimeloyl-ACP methyl ester carboxylesterase